MRQWVEFSQRVFTSFTRCTDRFQVTDTTRKWVLLGASGIVVVIALMAMFAPHTPVLAATGQLCVALLALTTLILPIPHSEARRPLARVLVDGAIVGTSMWTVVYQLVLIQFGTPAKLTVNRVGLISVVVTLVSLGLVLIVIGRVESSFRFPVMLVAGGLTIAAFAATLMCLPFELPAVILAASSVAGGALAISGLVVAALRLSHDHRPLDESASDVAWWRFAAVLPPVMVCVVVALAVTLALGGRTITSADYITGLVLLVLLVIQQLVANRERSQLVAELESRSALFQSLVTGSAELITLLDRKAHITYASPAVYRLLGISAVETESVAMSEYIHPEDLPGATRAMAEVSALPDRSVEFQMRVKCRVEGCEDWQWRWMLTGLHNQLANPDVQGIVANTRDIHDEHELGARLSFEAYHDALTGLGNLALARRIFAEYSYGSDRTPTTLMLLDLDGFKTLNDTFGHAFGDELLIAVSRRLRRNVSDEDAIARIGGDEFVLIFDSDEEAIGAASAILVDLRRPLLVQGTSVTVHASIGIARSIDADTSEELIRNADLAMYAAKADGGDTYVEYDHHMYEETANRMQIQDGLRSALDADAFELFIQPIMDLRTRRVAGGEVLLRWDDPTLGRIPPDVFIPIAESSGLISQIDQWVLRRTCALIKQWRSEGLSVPTISVNVSRRQITDGLDKLIESTLAESGVSADSICIEVTESAVVPDPEASVRVLDSVRRLGSRVSLDDFGTGQSSLSQLADLPVDRVKIDKSFVMPSSHDQAALDLLSSIVGLCHSLRLPVIAEGIEDETAAANLVAMGAQYGQGYHFFRPMPTADFRKLIVVEVPRQRTAVSAAPTVADFELADDLDVVADEQPGRADAGNH